MKLIVRWQDYGWQVEFEERRRTIPLSFLSFDRALEDLKRQFPDADIEILGHDLRCGTRPEPHLKLIKS